MFASILLLPLLLLVAPVDDGLVRSGAPDRDLAKMSEDINEYFSALEEDDRSQQKKSLDSLSSSLAKSLKKAKVDQPLTYYLGDWDRMLELAKPIARTFKSKAGKGFFKHVFEEPYQGTRLVVLLSLPSGYGKDEALAPVIVALRPAQGLHGKELEESVSDQATVLYGDLLQSHVVMVLLGPESGEGRKAVTTEVEDSWMSNEGLYAFYTSYRILLEQVRFDRSRVALDGWDGSGEDALRLITSTPSFFAGVIARGGDLAAPGLILGNLFRLSLLYVQADGTDVSAVDGGVEGVAVQVVEESASLAEPSDETRTAIVEWLGTLQKDLAPMQIDYRLGDLRFQSINWCKASLINKRATASPDDPDFPRIAAVIDRSKNEISIDSVNVLEMEVYLSDALVDMSKPVTIIVNGEEKWAKLAKPSLRVLLENRFYSDSGDYGLYTARVRLDNLDANVPGRDD